jgi:outer membrane immunogenic protein
MRRLLTGTAISLVMAASAGAADLPVYLKAPVPIYDWTGFYLGGGGSYSWGRVSDTGTYYPGFQGTTLPAATTRPIDHTLRGIDGEIQGGYRRQFGTMVVGIEGVARLTDQRGTGTCYEPYTSTNPYPSTDRLGTFTCYKGTRLNSTEAVLLQAGILATPKTFVFLSGGPALGQIHTDDAFAFIYTYPGSATTAGSSSTTTNKAGYWLGGGVEYAILNNLHLKLEYYHMDFGNVGTTTTWTDTTAFCTPTASKTACVNTFMNGRRVTDDSVMVGVNYSFGGAIVAPIYTKY